MPRRCNFGGEDMAPACYCERSPLLGRIIEWCAIRNGGELVKLVKLVKFVKFVKFVKEAPAPKRTGLV